MGSDVRDTFVKKIFDQHEQYCSRLGLTSTHTSDDWIAYILSGRLLQSAP